MWLILYGTIEHTNLTDSNVSIAKVGAGDIVDAKLGNIPSASATGTYAFPNMNALPYQGQFGLMLMKSDQMIYITSGNTALNYNIAYLEFRTEYLDELVGGLKL